MARGKYAAKAERRREFTGLEERAVTAERERDRLAVELAGLRESSGVKIAALKTWASDLREARDAAAAPRLAELEEANNRLRAEVMSMNADTRKLRADTRMFVYRVQVLLCERSVCSHLLEARELLCALTQSLSLRGMVPDAEAARELLNGNSHGATDPGDAG